MKWRLSLLMLLLLGCSVWAEEPTAAPMTAAGDMIGTSRIVFPTEPAPSEGGPLSGNHNYRNFINWISNPIQNIDPRAVTAIYPLFGSSWFSTAAPLPDGDMQLYGPAITIALSERFAVGLNQGGYAVVNLSKSQLAQLVALDPQGKFRDVEVGGAHTGWLNLGGFFQYTFIEDVHDQLIVTGGIRWEAPCGSHDVFQGHGPLHLAPYLTAGKEFGEYHALATFGYQFPAGPGGDNLQLFYLNAHLDRRCFGWLYPLVEVNWIEHSTDVNFGLTTRQGFVDFGTFASEGNLVTLAVGANAVLIPERLEIGAVYTAVLASQRNFDANTLIVKMTLRF